MTLNSLAATLVLTFGVVSEAALAAPPATRRVPATQQAEERLVFVTGSVIPQRVRLEPVTTATLSPLRVIDRHEIDRSGRLTTAGAFVGEPSLRVIGR